MLQGGTARISARAPLPVAASILGAFLPFALAVPTGAFQGARDSTWERALDLGPFASPDRARNVFPVLAGDKLLVSTTLVVHAIDASSGEIAWQAGPPSGWDGLDAPARNDLFKGIAERILVAPAFGGNVVVAALQIPWAADPAEEWQGIKISVAIPERRLFAFELSTGKELWNHAPPTDWDGKSDDYAERMAVAGPPVVAGSRVLVPCVPCYERANISYHVACYALETGALLWSTQVARGQKEHNMLGKLAEEFSAPPLVVDEGERPHPRPETLRSLDAGSTDLIIAQTNLGSVVALDVESGRMAWVSDYEKISLPTKRSYNVPRVQGPWQMSAPVVSAGVVICTPGDSLQLLGFDRRDGRRLWAHDTKELTSADPETGQFGFDLLLGAAKETLYLGGEKISALRKPHGLRSTAAFEPVWTFPIGRQPQRPCLTADSVFFPHENVCHVLDRRGGWPKPAIELRGEGNLLVAEDALFLLSSDRLFRLPR